MQTPCTSQTLALLFSGLLLLSAEPAAAQLLAPHLVYDTTAGVTMTYTGDLTAGTLSFTHIDGRNFRVQRIPQDGRYPVVDYGFFGTGGASFHMSLEFVEFIYHTPMGPPDRAYFAGAGAGADLVITDEFGNSMQASIGEFQMTDRTDSYVRPGYEGQGLLSDAVFTGPCFQNVGANQVQTEGAMYTFMFVIEQAPGDVLTLEEYLADATYHVPLENETFEMRVNGSECWGDFDGDNDIDQDDLGELLASYEQDGGGDLDFDCDTDQSDLGIFLANYGTNCP